MTWIKEKITKVSNNVDQAKIENTNDKLIISSAVQSCCKIRNFAKIQSTLFVLILISILIVVSEMQILVSIKVNLL